ncbi:SCO family protein [Nocardioides szechwanensis]|uniref:Protein SCO1/2 n=1 Tax=Nocardioides szechwanensis TaxID=1005944 RepID=A0A1G9VNW0_9ACTN|nr:SCO family protein [Nocardioides szechwanensis]GEP32881.1 SCO family protein [Nocardioides szechwanensis]SDM73505.1 protein SCO1/2 [Nocardioides szechwanensis]
MARAAVRVVTALFLLLALVGCGDDAASDDFAGTMLDNPLPAPDIALTDTEGEPYSLAADTDKRLTLVFFGYSRCPDICQTVMAALAGAMNRLDDEEREEVDVVFVTTDPKNDTPSALRTYLDDYDPSFIGLTGDIESIIAAGEPLAIYVSDGKELPGGGYDLGGHSTQITGIDSSDEAPVYWSQYTKQGQFAADIRTLLGKES